MKKQLDGYSIDIFPRDFQGRRTWGYRVYKVDWATDKRETPEAKGGFRNEMAALQRAVMFLQDALIWSSFPPPRDKKGT